MSSRCFVYYAVYLGECGYNIIALNEILFTLHVVIMSKRTHDFYQKTKNFENILLHYYTVNRDTAKTLPAVYWVAYTTSDFTVRKGRAFQTFQELRVRDT